MPMPSLATFGRYALYGLGAGALILLGRKIVSSILDTSQPAPTCSREFTAFNHGHARDMKDVSFIVMHATDPLPSDPEPTARSTASWFSQHIPTASHGPFSAHLVVGPDGCYQTVDYDVVAYGAGEPANARGLHIEQAGHSYWTRDQWLAHDLTLREAGGAVAGLSREFGIPLRFLYAKDLRALQAAGFPKEMGGITTHAEVSKAFHATTHADPGSNYPLDVLMGYAGGSMPSGGEPVA
jgi:N-acetylmuramoyl-L-alanine amidase